MGKITTFTSIRCQFKVKGGNKYNLLFIYICIYLFIYSGFNQAHLLNYTFLYLRVYCFSRTPEKSFIQKKR